MLPDDEKTLDAGSGPLVSTNVSAVLGSRLVYHFDNEVNPSIEVGTKLFERFSLCSFALYLTSHLPGGLLRPTPV
jgi:hypothetical protein